MGNGVYFKMIRCCYTNKNLNDADINVDGNIKDIKYINYKNNQYINEDEIQNKNDPKIIATKSKQSSRSGSQNKVKQNGENLSNKDQNISLCNNTMQINNSNLTKNNLIQNNLYNNRYNYNDQNEENRYKNSVINYNKNDNIKDNYIDIKTKLLLFGELFSNEIIEINRNGMKNSLKQRKDGLTIFGIKENTNSNDNLNNMYDYYLDLEKIDEINNNNNKLSGKVFEIYINKITRSYELYFLNNSLILYYKINNNIFFDLDKDYYLILGDIFLTILKSIKSNNF